MLLTSVDKALYSISITSTYKQIYLPNLNFKKCNSKIKFVVPSGNDVLFVRHRLVIHLKLNYILPVILWWIFVQMYFQDYFPGKWKINIYRISIFILYLLNGAAKNEICFFFTSVIETKKKSYSGLYKILLIN